MQRVLLLIPSMASVGGAERVVHSLSQLLVPPDHEVYQASFDAADAPRHFESSTPIHRLGPVPRLPLPLRPIAYAMAAWRLRRLKRTLGIDVTISNLWGADLISALSGGKDRKVALCHINIVGNASNRLMMKLRPLVGAVYRRFDRVIAVNASLAVELQALYRLGEGQCGYIDNFVDRPAVSSVLPVDEVMRFVWCGRFSPEKNVTGLLHAWAAIAADRMGVQLVLLGDGPQLIEMQALASALGLRMGADLYDRQAQVIFAGRVSEPHSFMLGARALLLSSYAEGLPMVVLEALALGVPVLAADCQAGGVRTALLGQGACEPDRTSVERAPAGLLLPVPRNDSPGSLVLWAEALRCACDEPVMQQKWQQGALVRASLFSSTTARRKWQQVLAFEELKI